MAQSFLFHSDPTTGNADDAGIADDDVPPAPPVGLANAAVGNRPRMAIAAIPSVPTPVQRIPGVPTLAARPPRPTTVVDSLDSFNCPVPRTLLDQLARVAQYPECTTWAASVTELCEELCRTSPGDVLRSAEIVRQMQALVPAAVDLAANVKNANAAENLRRARYDLERRLMVWNVMFNDNPNSVYGNVPGSDELRRRLTEKLTAADTHLQSIAHADGWRKYLLLDDVARLTSADDHPDQIEARQIARTVITRLSPRDASDAQRQVLGDATLSTLAEQLRPWAAESVDLHALLASIERYEISGLPSDGRQLVAMLEPLKWSASDSQRQLADILDMHYRNANIRVAISADLINRLTPDPAPATGKVNDTILNAKVSGSSQTKSELLVKLVPDPARLHVWVGARIDRFDDAIGPRPGHVQ